jgi:non-specific serine/threonine protein kinase
VAKSAGDYPTAEDRWQEGLAISRATGAINNTMLFLHNLGEAALRRNRLRDAEERYAECLALYRQVQHRAIASACLDGLAWVAAGEADYTRATRLYGAAETLRASLGRGSHAEYADRDQHVARVRAALGEPMFQELIGEGRSMALEAAIDYALSPGTAPPKAPTAAGRLTAREGEVAALIAAGLSNRDIAARLVVTERTAETHVQNILNKLGFSSRAQVAAWAVEQGLTKSARPQ